MHLDEVNGPQIISGHDSAFGTLSSTFDTVSIGIRRILVIILLLLGNSHGSNDHSRVVDMALHRVLKELHTRSG